MYATPELILDKLQMIASANCGQIHKVKVAEVDECIYPFKRCPEVSTTLSN